jgi:Family of unknown function (DUF5681)
MTDKGFLPPDDDYPVGYRRPPRHTQFKRDHSGNPKGRVKGSKNFSTLFSEELAKLVTITENGRSRRVPKGRALATHVINRALSKDLKGAAIVFDQIRHSEESTASPTTIDVERPESKSVIDSIVRRIRLADDAPLETDGPEGDGKESK